jgi:hypothetical protein
MCKEGRETWDSWSEYGSMPELMTKWEQNQLGNY